jgi:membrane protein implicated in regulation of membrane protease activity
MLWILWLTFAAILTIGEILTLGLVLAPFAAGAFASAVVGWLGGNFAVTLIVFLLVSITCLFALRPIARKHRRTPPRLRTGTEALVGNQATVVERIANSDNEGTVKLEGEVWTARAYDEDSVIEAGTQVHVVEIRGATALVAE